jgi:serine/threonine-protein kinase
VCLYALLSASHPFEGSGLTQILAAIRTRPHPRLREKVPGLSEAIVRIVDRCLEKKPADRFPDIGELIRALTNGRWLHPLRHGL